MEKKRILVVDDEKAIRESLEVLLVTEGHNIVTADSGSNALLAIMHAREKGYPFDLVVTDSVMPGLTGPELIREVSKLDPSLPFIIISGSPHSNRMFEGTAVGGNWEAILKPFGVQTICAAIERGIERRDAIRKEMHHHTVLNSFVVHVQGTVRV